MFTLPALPYAYDALSPGISEVTMRTHHDKHHAKYISTVNELVEESGDRNATLEDLIRRGEKAGKAKLANNAGQAWNHGFFWQAMSPRQTRPSAALLAAIDHAFGGFEAFKSEFREQGTAHFGSGWVWLVAKGATLSVTTTHDGQAILPDDKTAPILACDLWEHAYYLDYKNDREAFLKGWIDDLANWTFASEQYESSRNAVEGYRFARPHESVT